MFAIGGLAQPVVEITNNPGDAEICWFAGAPLPAGKVSCQPTVRPLILKDGVWTVFARRAPDLVALPVVAEGEAPRRLELRPAAKSTLSSRWFVYVVRAGTVLPATLIPADTDVLPIRVDEHTVAQIGDGGDYVVATIERRVIARDPLEAYLAYGDKRERPIVEIASTKTSLAVFKYRERAKVIVTGRGWKTVECDVPGRTGSITVLPEPIVATRVTKLAIHWWTMQQLDALVTGLDPDCAHAERNTWNLERDPAAPFAMTLMHCAQDNCKPIETQALRRGDVKGEVIFEDVTPGEYELRVTYPGLPPLSKRVRVEDEPQTGEDFELRYFTFFGRVTEKHDPIKARLFATVTDDDGMYRAVLPGALDRTSEFISPCDGSPSYRLLFDDPPRENARFDIELPDTTVHVTVVDEQTREPLRDALVRYTARHRDKTASFGDSVGKTDDTGAIDILHVDKGNELVVCAAHENYARRCSDPFVMTDDEESVALALTKGLALRGRIIATGALERCSVIWYAPDGTLRETAPVLPDGTFTFAKHHQPGEIVTVISTTQPLFVTRQLLATEDEQMFEITIPRVPERSLVITRSLHDGSGTKYVSIAVGGVAVPFTALNAYLMRRTGSQPFLDPGSTIRIPSILATGPMELIVLSGTNAADPDPILMPRNATVKRIPVADLTEIDISG